MAANFPYSSSAFANIGANNTRLAQQLQNQRMPEEQLYKDRLNPIKMSNYEPEDHNCCGISCSICGMGPQEPTVFCDLCGDGAPYGDERNMWLGYHHSWYHRLWYKLKADPAFQIFVRIY